MTKALNGQAFERFREDLGMPMARKLLKKAILAGGGQNKKEMEIAAGSFGAKMKLLAVIGADLVGKAVALRDVVPFDESDALMVAGVILMVIGAVWVAKQAVVATVGCARKPRRIQVEERPRDFIQVDRDIAELHDQWGRKWVVLKEKEKGLEQEHYWTADAASSSSTARVRRCSNDWNEFQHMNRGKGWGTEKMRAEYYKEKSKEKSK